MATSAGTYHQELPMATNSDDEEDLEALRLAALQTLRNRQMNTNPPPEVQVPRTVFKPHRANRNLIAIVPVSDDPLPNFHVAPKLDQTYGGRGVIFPPNNGESVKSSTFTAPSKPPPPKLILPQDRYCKLQPEAVGSSPDRTKVPAKFRRFEKSDSEESEDAKSDSESDTSKEECADKKAEAENEVAAEAEEESSKEEPEDCVVGQDEDFETLLHGLESDLKGIDEPPSAVKQGSEQVKESSETVKEIGRSKTDATNGEKSQPRKRPRSRSRSRSRSRRHRRHYHSRSPQRPKRMCSSPVMSSRTPSLSPSPDRSDSGSGRRRYKSPLRVKNSSPALPEKFYPKAEDGAGKEYERKAESQKSDRSPSSAESKNTDARRSKRASEEKRRSSDRRDGRRPAEERRKPPESKSDSSDSKKQRLPTPEREKLEARRRKFECPAPLVPSEPKKISLRGIVKADPDENGENSVPAAEQSEGSEGEESESRFKSQTSRVKSGAASRVVTMPFQALVVPPVRKRLERTQESKAPVQREQKSRVQVQQRSQVQMQQGRTGKKRKKERRKRRVTEVKEGKKAATSHAVRKEEPEEVQGKQEEEENKAANVLEVDLRAELRRRKAERSGWQRNQRADQDDNAHSARLMQSALRGVVDRVTLKRRPVNVLEEVKRKPAAEKDPIVDERRVLLLPSNKKDIKDTDNQVSTISVTFSKGEDSPPSGSTCRLPVHLRLGLPVKSSIVSSSVVSVAAEERAEEDDEEEQPTKKVRRIKLKRNNAALRGKQLHPE